LKKLILVTGVPASGKNYISNALLGALQNTSYFDKDDLCDLVDCTLKIANQPSNRDTDFFNQNVRPFEYKTIERLAFTSLRHSDNAIINAPYISQLSDAGYMSDLKQKANAIGAELAVIWVDVPEKSVLKHRMQARASERDEWKLEHFDEYYESIRISPPTALELQGAIDKLIVFSANTDGEFEKSLKLALKYIKE
jgi:tRNA uridine 5-carbamoylmethylation protein Kti12